MDPAAVCSTLHDGRRGWWCFQSGVPVVYLYCVRRNSIIMVVAGVSLFRPTQLKLDGILTCTCTKFSTSAARRICEFLHVESFALALLA